VFTIINVSTNPAIEEQVEKDEPRKKMPVKMIDLLKKDGRRNN
jgi:hypothetical protein